MQLLLQPPGEWRLDPQETCVGAHLRTAFDLIFGQFGQEHHQQTSGINGEQ